MVQVSVILVAAGWLGWQGYLAYDRSQYGISGTDPIGSFEAMDAYLTGSMGMRKTEASGPDMDTSILTNESKYWRYLDTTNGNGNNNDEMVLILDSSGRLIGIVGFTRPSFLPVASFCMNHWKRVFHEKPHAEDGEARATRGEAGGQASFSQHGTVRFFFYAH